MEDILLTQDQGWARMSFEWLRLALPWSEWYSATMPVARRIARRRSFKMAVGIAALLLFATCARASKPKPAETRNNEPGALELYIREAERQAKMQPAPSSGSLWQAGAPLGNLFRDPRAYQADDLVTIVVAESLSALSSGTTQTKRASAAAASVGALGHKYGGSSAMSNLANLGSNSTLDSTGSTMRQTSLTTSLSARVAHVLPNGYLVVEGQKTVQVNSEKQVISVRGVVRPTDLGPDNSIQSDQLAQMEISVNGKGVVGDAIRRPNRLYRLLMGLLPF